MYMHTKKYPFTHNQKTENTSAGLSTRRPGSRAREPRAKGAGPRVSQVAGPSGSLENGPARQRGPKNEQPGAETKMSLRNQKK